MEGTNHNMRCLSLTLSMLFLAACSREKPLTGSDAVAWAGTQQLSVDRLADIMATEDRVPLAREFAERLAHLWVEFTLFTERAAAGDSLLDSATVLRAMWPEVNQALVDAHYEAIVADRLRLSADAVDSAYAAGEHRIIRHVLIATAPDMTPDQRADARRRTDRIHARLVAGGSWAEANEGNDDTAAKAQGGSLGVIRRGQMVIEFEDVAFGLAPGELSEVVETAYGYHVVLRPQLDAVRDDYARAVENIAKERLTEVYLDELGESWRVRVHDHAAASMRQAAGAPLRARSSTEVIGSHREADFTVADFVRWLQVLPLAMQQQVATAADPALTEMVRSMIRNEALVMEARARGISLDTAMFDDIRAQLSTEVAVVRSALAVGITPEPAGVTAERYVRQLVGNLETSVVVPTFLARALRSDGEWMVSEPALDLVIDHARMLQMQMAVPRAQGTVIPVNDSSR